jgi:signal transduction histidine kinase/CheY-like chemotaxis protein
MKKFSYLKGNKLETSPKMGFNKITLSFPVEIEQSFLQQYFKDTLIQFRVSFVLVSLLYGVFGYLDILLTKEYTELFHFIRYGVVIPLLSAVFIFSFTRYFIKIWQLLLFVCFIVAGTGIIVMTVLVPENYAYYAGVMLIFSAGYFFIKLRFLLASIAGWITLLFFNIGAIFFSTMKSDIIISNNFFFIAANLIGMFAAYNIEFYTRRDFFLNQQLDSRNDEITEVNKNLESIVNKRTSELLQEKEHAQQSDRLKSAFLANMSHEIRTPMNGILGFTELLKEPNLTGDQQNRYIEIIRKSGDRMLNTINDIIDIAKIESGEMIVSITETIINDEIESIYSFFKPEVEQKNLQFIYNPIKAEEVICMNTDREKIYCVFSNLVKNAIKFTTKGSIEIGFTKKEDHLEFFVKDTGVGIGPEMTSVVFERFRQVEDGFSRGYEGSGLGLSISKAYTEMLGGKIWVESELGKGSDFYFTIPVPIEPETKIGTPDLNAEDNTESLVNNLKVLIAEDDADSEMLITLAMKMVNREILIAHTGIEAVEYCRNHTDIDLILMDIRMPYMDGYEATRQIRQFNTDVVIIAQTANALVEDRGKAITAGCTDYISKPIDKQLLMRLIKKHFAISK